MSIFDNLNGRKPKLQLPFKEDVVSSSLTGLTIFSRFLTVIFFSTILSTLSTNIFDNITFI